MQILLAVLVAAIVSPSQSRGGDPDLVYSTISTEHFNIHYHQGLEALAKQAATIAEEVHLDLAIRMGWEVSGTTEMVIIDPTDQANGMASASPRPQIILYAVHPDMNSALQHHDQWLRTLIIHEYTHVVHLQMQSGLSKVINSIFGDVYLLNQMNPRWFVEGLSVLEETEMTTMGRIRSSYYKMVIRTHALEGKLLTLGEMSNPTVEYPRGNTDYIYGALFMDYLHTRFGHEKLIEICHEYSGEVIPYGLNRIFRRVTGEELATLHQDWIAQVEQTAQEEKAAVAQEGITPFTQITHSGETKGRPIFTPDGQSVIMPISDGEIRSGIFQFPLDGSPKTRLALSGGQSQLSMSANGSIYYTRSAPFKNTYRFTDIFTLSHPGAEPRRITHGLRAREAAISPSGNTLAMVTVANGNSSLILSDNEGNSIRTLYEPEPDSQVFNPAWSPDEQQVVFLKRTGPQIDIAIVDVQNGTSENITNDYAIEGSPTYSTDGTHIIYSSDLSGISNIYAYEIHSGKVLQLTNVVTGAGYPALSPDQTTLAYLYYNANGWDLHTTKVDLKNAKIIPPTEKKELSVAPIPTPDDSTPSPYNPLPSFLPRSWNLSYVKTGAGNAGYVQAAVALSDAVNLHYLGIEFNYDIDLNTPSVATSYSYYGMLPVFQVSFSYVSQDMDRGYLVDGETKSWIRRKLNGGVGLSVPIAGVDRNHRLSFGYILNYTTPRDNLDIVVDPDDDLPDLPVQYFRSGLRFGWSFTDLYRSPFAISTEKGRSLYGYFSIYNPVFGGNQELGSFSWGWKEYIPAPWALHHIFALNLSGKLYISNPPGQANMSAGGYNDQQVLNSIWNSTPYGVPTLRGYAPRTFKGDHMHSLKFEYRFPLWWAQAAYETLPLFFQKLHAGLFADTVMISYEPFAPEDIRTGVGAELVWSFVLGYYMPVTLRTGYARGVMEGGINEFIFIFGGTY